MDEDPKVEMKENIGILPRHRNVVEDEIGRAHV